MAKTLEEQISGKCIHFNGIMNPSCKIGILYSELTRPLPCIKVPSGNTYCASCKFPSKEEVDEKLKSIRESTSASMLLMVTVKDHYKKTKQSQASIKCPNGEHNLSYAIAQNGHARIRCNVCQISLME